MQTWYFIHEDKDEAEIFADTIEENALPVTLEWFDDCELLLSRLDRQLPDLVLLDDFLLKMTTLECLSEIKKSKGLTQLPVLILTNQVSKVSKYDAYVAGAHKMIEMPSTVQDYGDMIHFLYDVKNQGGRDSFDRFLKAFSSDGAA